MLEPAATERIPKTAADTVAARFKRMRIETPHLKRKGEEEFNSNERCPADLRFLD
jgi:hypothetical protein